MNEMCLHALRFILVSEGQVQSLEFNAIQ